MIYLKFQIPNPKSKVKCPAAELRGIKIQNLFPCRHSCASRNPVYVGPLFSKEQAWIPTFVGMTDEVTLYQATWNYQFKTLKHFVFGEPVFIRPAELGGIQQVSFINPEHPYLMTETALFKSLNLGHWNLFVI